MTDQALLEDFVRRGSAQAFRAIVARYAGLVRASARRQVRDDHVADDVTQAVFIVLARRAASIRDAGVLPAWLIKTTCFASRDALKLEARRRRHEQKAAEMAPTQIQPHDPDFADLAPALDAALAKLKTADRNIVARRYLQQQTVEEIAVELHMSDAAVRKRLSRAMPKLRAYLSRQGVTMSIAALTAAMLSAPPATADAATIDSAADAALAAAEGATVAASAASIAAAAFGRLRLARLAAAMALLLMLTLLGGAVFALQRGGPTARATVPLGPKIKVGVMVSDYTATGPTGQHMGTGFGGLNVGLQKLDDPRFERYAIIEPGTAHAGRVPEIIQRYFAPGRVIDGSNVEQLRALDVIACFNVVNMRDDVLDAVIVVVRDDGVGVLNQVSTGCNRPGLTEPVNLVNGIKRYGCLYYPGAWECDVLVDHPLISELKPMIGTRKLRLEGNLSGSIGVLPEGAVPLIAAPGVPNHHTLATPVPPDTVFYPLYLSQLGKGRIVCLQWNAAQRDLEALTNGKFYPRCVQWLANRPLD